MDIAELIKPQQQNETESFDDFIKSHEVIEPELEKEILEFVAIK